MKIIVIFLVMISFGYSVFAAGEGEDARCDKQVGQAALEKTKGVGPDLTTVRYLGKQDSIRRTSGKASIHKAYFVKTSTESHFFVWIVTANAINDCQITQLGLVDKYNFD